MEGGGERKKGMGGGEIENWAHAGQPNVRGRVAESYTRTLSNTRKCILFIS